LAAGDLVRRRGLVVGELGGAGFQVADDASDRVPGVRQRRAHGLDEVGVVDGAAFGGREQVG